MNIATRCGGHHATVMANAMENPRATTICNMLPCGRSRGGRAVIFRHPIPVYWESQYRDKTWRCKNDDGAGPSYLGDEDNEASDGDFA